jgi:hypothetical protein
MHRAAVSDVVAVDVKKIHTLTAAPKDLIAGEDYHYICPRTHLKLLADVVNDS